MALRRWKPFLPAFDHIDAAIVSAGGGVPRVEFKHARNRIVEALCGAADDTAAEGICSLLDEAMAESLVTLRTVVHANKMSLDLLASGELVAAVGALARGHASERVRGLARGLVRGWRAAVEAELATARAAMDVLDRVFQQPTMPRPEGTATGVSGSCSDHQASADLGASAVPVKIAEPSPKKKTSPNMQASAKAPAPQQPKKTVTPSPPAARSSSGGDRLAALCISADTKKMEATKRKLQERYQEAEDAKRRRTIQVLLVAPEMPRQQGRRATHPAVKARGPACSAVQSRRRFSISSVRRV